MPDKQAELPGGSERYLKSPLGRGQGERRVVEDVDPTAHPVVGRTLKTYRALLGVQFKSFAFSRCNVHADRLGHPRLDLGIVVDSRAVVNLQRLSFAHNDHPRHKHTAWLVD